MWMFFSAYMSGSSSPATSSAPTIYQLSSLPPPSTLSEASIDTDLLKPPGMGKQRSIKRRETFKKIVAIILSGLHFSLNVKNFTLADPQIDINSNCQVVKKKFYTMGQEKRELFFTFDSYQEIWDGHSWAELTNDRHRVQDQSSMLTNLTNLRQFALYTFCPIMDKWRKLSDLARDPSGGSVAALPGSAGVSESRCLLDLYPSYIEIWPDRRKIY